MKTEKEIKFYIRQLKRNRKKYIKRKFWDTCNDTFAIGLLEWVLEE